MLIFYVNFLDYFRMVYKIQENCKKFKNSPNLLEIFVNFFLGTVHHEIQKHFQNFPKKIYEKPSFFEL